MLDSVSWAINQSFWGADPANNIIASVFPPISQWGHAPNPQSRSPDAGAVVMLQLHNTNINYGRV